jgi:hypothetical protein
MLEALSIHDKTLWYQKLSDAIVKFKEKDQQQKVKKETGLKLKINILFLRSRF